MRLSTAQDRDEARAHATVAAALGAGVRWLDTAPSYAHGEHELHHNEALIARALRSLGVSDVTVVTKTGLTRRGTAWVPDGRARAITASAERSAEVLGAPLQVLLLHAIDPAVPLSTSMRALEALRARGLTRSIGLCHPTRAQLLEALEHGDVTHVQLPMSVHDETAERSGVLAVCRERGLTVHAHTPLGGPARARRSDGALAAIAQRHGVSEAQVAIAYVAARGAVPLVGATRPETAMELGHLPALTEDDLGAIAQRHRPPVSAAAPAGVEVVLLVGSQGAGKSRLAARLVSDGYRLLSRDVRGGTLSGLSKELAAQLGGAASSDAPPRGWILDNTAGTRAQRAEMIAVARAAGAEVRAIWLDVPMAIAQANVARRIARVLGRLATPEELKRSKDPRVVPPRALFAYARTFEPPELDEGFVSIERLGFARESSGQHSGVAISLDVLTTLERLPQADRVLVYGWAPEGADAIRARVAEQMDALGATYELLLCEHGGGPPVCWCRPPLPGLLAAWIERADIDVSRTTVLGAGRIERTLAEAIGATLG